METLTLLVISAFILFALLLIFVLITLLTPEERKDRRTEADLRRIKKQIESEIEVEEA